MYEQVLKSMGRGWFILKLAEDNGVYTGSSSNYGAGIKTRLSIYNKTLNEHKFILLELINGWDNRVVGGNPKLTNQELYDIAIRLINYFKLRVAPVINIPVNKKVKVQFPFNESDHDAKHVRYERNVKDGEKVEGLCSYLEEYYDSIIEHIERLFNIAELPKIDVVLSKACPSEIINNDVAEWLKNEFKIYGDNLSKDRINEIINNKDVELSILGKFIESKEKPYIVIYFRNMIENDRHKYFINILQILAHEYFHLFHYLYTKGKNSSKDKWIRLSVNESLADIFAFDYLHYNSANDQLMINVANERYNFWIKFFGSKVPYAQALRYFINNQNINYKKIEEVLNMSAINMNDAYKILIK